MLFAKKSAVHGSWPISQTSNNGHCNLSANSVKTALESCQKTVSITTQRKYFSNHFKQHFFKTACESFSRIVLKKKCSNYQYSISITALEHRVCLKLFQENISILSKENMYKVARFVRSVCLKIF